MRRSMRRATSGASIAGVAARRSNADSRPRAWRPGTYRSIESSWPPRHRKWPDPEPLMSDIARLDEQYAIIADTDRASAPLRVLKQVDTFGVFDQHGDVIPAEAGEQGLYHAGTRFVSRYDLLVGHRRPLLLSSTISEDNTIFAVNLTNPDLLKDTKVVVPRGALHVFRARLLWDGHCLERIRVSNHARHAIQLPVALHIDADFADVFEVRGTHRARRGLRLDDHLTRDNVVMLY